jgi:hypothetical protein
MAVDDRLRDVDQLPAVVLRVVPEHFEGAVSIERVPRRQDAFRRAARQRRSRAGAETGLWAARNPEDADSVLPPATAKGGSFVLR